MDVAVTVGHWNGRGRDCRALTELGVHAANLRMKLGNHEQRCGNTRMATNKPNGRDPPTGTVPASSVLRQGASGRDGGSGRGFPGGIFGIEKRLKVNSMYVASGRLRLFYTANVRAHC